MSSHHTRRSVAAVLLLAAPFAVAAPASPEPAPGWWARGSRPQDYAMGFDKQALHAGKPTAYIRSIADDPKGFGTLMRKIDAAPYRGKRVRLSTDIRTEALTMRAGLWMRVDGPKEPLAIDNMDDRPITGTTSWRRYECVLDVAPSATRIAFGVGLAGAGRVQFGSLTMEVVDASVPITDLLPTIPPERYRGR
jgi:hypothetical protein